MKTLVTILFLPARGTRTLRERPRWIGAFLLLAMMSVGLIILTERQTAAAVLARLPSSATPSDNDAAVSMLSETLVARSLFEPIRLLAGWSAFAGILFVFVRTLSPPEPVRYLRLFALEVHAEAALLVGRIAAAVSAMLGHASAWPEGGAAPYSAALLVPSTHSFTLLSLLSSANIFTLWYVVLLAAGLRVLCGITIRTAALVALGAWALSVLFDTGIFTLLIDTLHLRV